jgi:DNA-binding NarL/FixJ family response regulator
MLQRLCQDLLDNQIACECDVDERTIQAHVSDSFREADAGSPPEAALETSKPGLRGRDGTLDS